MTDCTSSYIYADGVYCDISLARSRKRNKGFALLFSEFQLDCLRQICSEALTCAREFCLYTTSNDDFLYFCFHEITCIVGTFQLRT